MEMPTLFFKVLEESFEGSFPLAQDGHEMHARLLNLMIYQLFKGRSVLVNMTTMFTDCGDVNTSIQVIGFQVLYFVHHLTSKNENM